MTLHVPFKLFLVNDYVDITIFSAQKCIVQQDLLSGDGTMGAQQPPPPGSVKSKVSRGFLVRMGIEIPLKKDLNPLDKFLTTPLVIQCKL